ncbi:hypothetical protein ACJX0J_016402, partial [Zea mays]
KKFLFFLPSVSLKPFHFQIRIISCSRGRNVWTTPILFLHFYIIILNSRGLTDFCLSRRLLFRTGCIDARTTTAIGPT